MELEEAISKRKSIRHYEKGEVTQEEVNVLLWAASKCPSAGGTRPLKIYEVRDGDKKRELCNACLGQKPVENADIDLVIVANYEKIVPKYHKRGYRYAAMEAGHVGQNISLIALSMGLGTVMIGAFKDEVVKKVLGITEEPLYVIPVGRVNAV